MQPDNTAGPLFEQVVCSGVGVIELRGGKRTLVIYTSRQDALHGGVSEERARQLFPEIAGGQRFCKEVWGFGGNSFSCTDDGCTTGTCTVQVNRLDGLGWTDASEGSVVVNRNWAYRCNCK